MSNPEATLVDADLLGALGLDDLLPASLAAWRPLLAAGLSYFLERLPKSRLSAMVADQLALPADASPAWRVARLFSHCPTLHKLGQVVARQRALPPELRTRLQGLESMPATAPASEVTETIRRELGNDPSVTFGPACLAEGSVAVVLPFTYQDRSEVRHGVFKVLRPGIESRLADELALLPEVADFLAAEGASLGLPPLDYRDALETVRRLLAQEIRFDLEQRNLQAAAAFYAHEPRVLVPRLLPWCTPRLTAMERVFGAKVTDASLPAPARRALADTLVDTLLGQPFWSRAEEAVFHADLHAGNIFLADDGRLALLDWSQTARLRKHEREALLGIALGGLTLDGQKIQASLARLGIRLPDRATLAVIEDALDRLVFQARLPGFGWLLELLDNLALVGASGLREDFALFRKSWLSLHGILGDLTPDPAPDLPMLRLGLKRWLGEWPERWLAPARTSAFATHVSNAEAMGIVASSWLTSLRYWQRHWQRWRPQTP